MPQKDVSWATYLKTRGGKKTATGYQCQSCATVAAVAYRDKQWHEVVSMVKASDVVAETFRVAKAVLAGTKERKWLTETVQEEAANKCKVVESYVILDEGEFEEVYGLKLGKHPTLQSLFQPIPGLGEQKWLVIKDPQTPLRKLVVERSAEVACYTHIMSPTDMLRPLQGHDLQKYLSEERGKHQPSLYNSSKSKVHMYAKIDEMVAAAKAVPDPAAAPATPEAEPAPLAGDSPQSNEEIENNVAQPLMPSLSLGTAAGKGKGKGKTKSKSKSNKGKRGRIWSAGTLDTKRARGAASASDAARVAEDVSNTTEEFERHTIARTTAARSIAGASTAHHTQQQYEKWLAALSVHDTLSGIPMKNTLYQAGRIQKGLDDSSGEHASLSAAMKTVTTCEKLVNLKALTVADRTEKLEEVLGVQGGNELLPPSF
eukprot:6488140-Amphidinium_carterae.1